MTTYKPTPTQKAFMLDDHYVRVLAGPVGGGKSVACVHELLRLSTLQAPNAKGIRKSRTVIVRNTADQLAQTTRKTIFDWVPPGVAGYWKATDRTFYINAALPDGTRLEAEWLMIALDTPDDVRKALSLEATFLWGNECRELHMDVVDGLLGRLNRYPSPKDGGPTRSCAIFDTNMPDADSAWHEKMENPPSNWAIFKQPPAILRKSVFIERHGDQVLEIPTMQGPLLIDPSEPQLDKDGNEWLVNPEADNVRVLNPAYYPNLIPGKTEDWLRVYLRSEYGRSLSGTPVYERSFTPEFHIASEPLKYIRGESYPIVIGIDFGRTPAAVFKQRDPRGRVLTLGEITSENMGIETFINTKLNPYIANHFQGATFVCAPDPAGFAKQQLNEMSLVDVLKKAGFKCVKPPSNDPEKRIQAVERLLLQQLDGKAMYLVDPSCDMLIRGFRFGYRYKIKKNGELEDRPDKNAFSHCMVAGTPVATPDGERPIETLLPGDWVLTRSGARQILGTMSRLAVDLVEVSCGGRTVVCTADHPFIVSGLRVRADALQNANILGCAKEKHVIAASAVVRRIDVPQPTVVYDLTVADDHEFFAAGMLVGNCHDANQYADSVIDMNIRGVALQTTRREVRKVSTAW